MPLPSHPKIYHITHIDRLPSIVAEGYVWCDRAAMQKVAAGTTIGMNEIKERRLNELTLQSHTGLFVGDCVPFYFCPRSVMLYVISRGNNPNLSYTGGQGLVLHLEADLHNVVAWANASHHKWAFTTSNAGSYHFADFSSISDLSKINWAAVAANDWRDPDTKEGKQAELLVEHSFPFALVERIGVLTPSVLNRVDEALRGNNSPPPVAIMPSWYY